MTAFLIIRAGNIEHRPFQYDTFAEAYVAAQQALADGVYKRTEPDMMKEGAFNYLYIQLGPGSILFALSEEAAQRQENASRSIEKGVDVVNLANPDLPFKLVTQLASGGQLEPAFGYRTMELAQEAVLDAIKFGYIRHAMHDDHQIFVQGAPGTLYMTMNNEHYQMQRRKAIADVMQKAMQKKPDPSKLIVSS